MSRDKETGLPKNYITGLSKSTAKARKAHWKKMSKYSDKDPRAYQPAPGDARAKTRPSKHTLEVRKMMNEEADKSLAAKAKKTGISLSTLKTVYRRGVAAWNSGHRPGTTPQQWGHARVNSYIRKGTTYHTADKDLREDAPTNSMGASSSTPGTGAIDTYDPLLKKTPLKRFKAFLKGVMK